jgi:mannose-6-phosphate isomerase-like protein (cupin superfamily)
MQMIDIMRIADQTADRYFNRVVAESGDQVVRMSVMTEPFAWHRHPDADEVFIGLDGTLLLEALEGDAVTQVRLARGQIAVVPRGTIHRTRPESARSVNLTVERADAATEWCEGPVAALRGDATGV